MRSWERHVRVIAAGLTVALAVSGWGGGLGHAHAAEKSGLAARKSKPSATPEKIPPMHVVVVRAARHGCEPSCPVWISAEGPMGEGSADRFRAVIASLGSEKPPVLIHSPGGSVEQSFAVGRLIRNAGLTVVVGATKLEACGPGKSACPPGTLDKPRIGTPMSRAACASACAFVLAAGQSRYAGVKAYIGVHDIKTWQISRQVLRKYVMHRDEDGVVTRELVSEKTVSQSRSVISNSNGSYTKIEAYMTEMGIKPGFLPIMRSAPNSSIHWMKPAELTETQLLTGTADAETVVEGLIAAPTPAVQKREPNR
jgi:hypothetical protein